MVQQTPLTVSNVKQMCKEWTSNHVDRTKSLTAEAKELNMSKTKFGISTVENFQPLCNDQSVNLVSKN